MQGNIASKFTFHSLTPAPSSEGRRFSFARKEDRTPSAEKAHCLPPAASVRVIRLFALGGLAKLRGGFVIVALEGAAEAPVVGIAYLQGDFGDGKMGAGEQGHALLQTDFFQIGGEAELGFIAQKRLQGALVYPEDIGDRGPT